MKGKCVMLRIVVFMIIGSILCGLFTVCNQGNGARKDGVRVLFLMPRNIGANNFLIRDVFEEYGWHVTRTAVLDTIPPCGFWGRHPSSLPLLPEVALSEVGNVAEYDVLFIATSPGQAWQVPDSYQDVLESPEALGLVKSAVNEGLAVFAMCAGVRVLATADVIANKQVVGAPRFQDEFRAAGAVWVGNERNDNGPLISGNIITGARGQTYNVAIGQAIATVVEGKQTQGPKTLSNGHIKAGMVDFTPSETVWARTYGGPGSDGGRAFCVLPDGGFLITGYTFAPGSRDADILVVKTDNKGRMIWARTFGGSGTEYGNGCTAVEDGYLVTGYTTSFGAGQKDVYLVKIDPEGREIWSKTYGGESWDVGMSVAERPDGRYFVSGFTRSFGAGEEDVYLLKIDRNGDELGSWTFGGERIEMGGFFRMSDDGGCVMGASSLSYGGKNTDFWLVRTDAEGGMLWMKAHGANPKPGHGFDWCKAVTVTRDGGIVATGYSDTNDLMDAVVIRTDAWGNKIWLKTFGDQPFYQYGNSVDEMPDGSILLAGMTKSMREVPKKGETVYNNDIFLVKIDGNGELVWERTVGGHRSDWANSALVTQNGEIVVLGHTNSGGRGGYDVCLVKIRDSDK